MKNQKKINFPEKFKSKLSFLTILFLAFSLVIVSCESDDDDDDDDAADTTQQQIVGTWIGFFDEVIPDGPNGEPCDAVFFDIDNTGNVKILSFLGGIPAAGHKGTYSFDGDELVLSLTHDWAEELDGADYLNWVEAPYEIAIYAAISSDGNVLTAGPSETEAWQVNKIELSDPDDGFMGDWFDDGADGLFQISSPASYEYEEPGYSESGLLEQFTFTDGNTYFLSKTTYTSDVGGPCDAYFVGRVALNETENEMTLSFGDYETVYTRQ